MFMTGKTESGGFEALGLKPELLASVTELGYEEPTPIQRAAVPPLLLGRDVLGQAATGTGKTAAFALPLLHQLTPGACGPFEASALILVPTRELAMQVAEAVHSYGKKLGASVLPIYGGQEIGAQLKRLKRGVDVVVATPGRALDHLRRKTLKLERVTAVVLDEADEMLDMGFEEDLEAILSGLPEERQTALFSATLAPRIAAIAERHLRDPVRLKIAREKASAGTLPKVRQVAYLVPNAFKQATLGRVLDLESIQSAIVFCRTRTEVDTLSDRLSAHGFRAQALHGGMDQPQRDRVMKLFKNRSADLLVATDVAARGLDIEHVSHVINYDLPTSPEVYVHRIGRTGRAGREGVAITLAEPRELRLLKAAEQRTGQKIELASVPTIIDVRARRLELTRATLREALVAGDFDGFRSVVDALGAEFELPDIAAAAVKLLHEASFEGAMDETEIPTLSPPRDRPAGKAGPRTERPMPGAGAGPGPRGKAPRNQGWDVVRLFIGLGRRAGIRPADLVGAIVNEAGVKPKSVGAIEIADAHSLVEVPSADADQVIRALRETKLRGRKVIVRKDRA
jgi:ATP-dependent RNA helicase DeaD